MFKVAELIKATGGKLICGRPDTQVDSISTDSRSRKMRGAAFLALRGANFDGHDFIRAEINQGAGLIIAEASASHLGPRHRKVAFIEVRDTLRALGISPGSIARSLSSPLLPLPALTVRPLPKR